jgi:hypothetical protein
VDKQRSPKERCRDYSKDNGEGRKRRGFSEMQEVKGMPSLHVHRNNRFAILEVKKANESTLNQAMPTDFPIVESSMKP